MAKPAQLVFTEGPFLVVSAAGKSLLGINNIPGITESERDIKI